MTQPTIPHNAYTHSPIHHPNWIIGSVQLLFWLVFRPSAWENHIQRLDLSHLNPAHNAYPLSRHRLRNNHPLRQFVVQSFLLLPILVMIAMALICLGIGIPINDVALCVIANILIGIPSGLVFGTTFHVALGVTTTVAFAITSVVVFSTSSSEIIDSLVLSAAYGASTGVSFGAYHKSVADIWQGLICAGLFGTVGVISGGSVAGIVGGIAAGLGVWINLWRPIVLAILLTPWHFFLYHIDKFKAGTSPSVLHRHVAFWDEWQYIPIPGLDRHLLLVIERSPAEGQAALNYLSTSRQRWAAQAAQIELDARQLERYTDVMAMGQSHHSFTAGELTGPADTVFRSFGRVSEDVEAALMQQSVYNQRLALTAVSDRLDNLIRELTRSSDKYAVRFRPIAQRWHNIIELHLADLAKAAELNQEIDSPYIISVPLTEKQQIFVGRTDLSDRIENLLLDRLHPPLLLYGQRRMGKTSLLKNLGRLLPNSIIPLFVDLQGPASRASNHAGFLYNLAKGMADSAQSQRALTLPPLPREDLADDPFTSFDEWLTAVETCLGSNTALLMLDEFEALDKALTTNRFDEADVLGMLRNLIQQRPKFKVLIAGSHTLQEFQRWSSYLINAQVLHISYLREPEARQLIEAPCPGFALRYEPNASQRVLDVTRGHPCMVQLLCAEIVVLKNEQDPSIRRLATLTDVEAAIPEALEHGSMFFSDIEGNQLDARSLAVLRYIAVQGEGAVVSFEQLLQQFSEGIEEARSLLLRRELIEAVEGGDRIQIELFRRWFAPE